MRSNLGDLIPAVLLEYLNDFPAVHSVYYYTLPMGLSIFSSWSGRENQVAAGLIEYFVDMVCRKFYKYLK